MAKAVPSLRVHLASPGADVIRVFKPLQHYGCSRLHLVLQPGNDPLYEDIADEVERQAREWHPDIEVRRTPVQLFDGPQVFNAIHPAQVKPPGSAFRLTFSPPVT